MLRKLAGITENSSRPRFISRNSAQRLKHSTILTPKRNRLNQMKYLNKNPMDENISQDSVELLFTNQERERPISTGSYTSVKHDSSKFNFQQIQPLQSNIDHQAVKILENKLKKLESRYENSIELLMKREEQIESLQSKSIIGLQTVKLLENKLKKMEGRYDNSIELLMKREDMFESKIKKLETQILFRERNKEKFYEGIESSVSKLESNSEMNKELVFKIVQSMKSNLVSEIRNECEIILHPIKEELETYKKLLRALGSEKKSNEVIVNEITMKMKEDLISTKASLREEMSNIVKKFKDSMNKNMQLVTELTSNLKSLMSSKMKFISVETTNALKEVNKVATERNTFMKIHITNELVKIKKKMDKKLNVENKMLSSHLKEHVNMLLKKIMDLKSSQRRIFIRLEKEAQLSKELNTFQYTQNQMIQDKLNYTLGKIGGKAIVNTVMNKMFFNMNTAIDELEISHRLKLIQKNNVDLIKKTEGKFDTILNEKFSVLKSRSDFLDSKVVSLKDNMKKEVEKMSESKWELIKSGIRDVSIDFSKRINEVKEEGKKEMTKLKEDNNVLMVQNEEKTEEKIKEIKDTLKKHEINIKKEIEDTKGLLTDNIESQKRKEEEDLKERKIEGNLMTGKIEKIGVDLSDFKLTTLKAHEKALKEENEIKESIAKIIEDIRKICEDMNVSEEKNVLKINEMTLSFQDLKNSSVKKRSELLNQINADLKALKEDLSKKMKARVNELSVSLKKIKEENVTKANEMREEMSNNLSVVKEDSNKKVNEAVETINKVNESIKKEMEKREGVMISKLKAFKEESNKEINSNEKKIKQLESKSKENTEKISNLKEETEAEMKRKDVLIRNKFNTSLISLKEDTELLIKSSLNEVTENIKKMKDSSVLENEEIMKKISSLKEEAIEKSKEINNTIEEEVKKVSEMINKVTDTSVTKREELKKSFSDNLNTLKKDIQKKDQNKEFEMNKNFQTLKEMIVEVEIKSGSKIKDLSLMMQSNNEENNKNVNEMMKQVNNDLNIIKEESFNALNVHKQDNNKALNTLKEDNSNSLNRFKEDNDKALNVIKEESTSALNIFKEENNKALNALKEDSSKTLNTFLEDNKKAMSVLKENSNKAINNLKEESTSSLNLFKEDNLKAMSVLKEDNNKSLQILKEENLKLINKNNTNNEENTNKLIKTINELKESSRNQNEDINKEINEIKASSSVKSEEIIKKIDSDINSLREEGIERANGIEKSLEEEVNKLNSNLNVFKEENMKKEKEKEIEVSNRFKKIDTKLVEVEEGIRRDVDDVRDLVNTNVDTLDTLKEDLSSSVDDNGMNIKQLSLSFRGLKDTNEEISAEIKKNLNKKIKSIEEMIVSHKKDYSNFVEKNLKDIESIKNETKKNKESYLNEINDFKKLVDEKKHKKEDNAALNKRELEVIMLRVNKERDQKLVEFDSQIKKEINEAKTLQREEISRLELAIKRNKLNATKTKSPQKISPKKSVKKDDLKNLDLSEFVSNDSLEQQLQLLQQETDLTFSKFETKIKNQLNELEKKRKIETENFEKKISEKIDISLKKGDDSKNEEITKRLKLVEEVGNKTKEDWEMFQKEVNLLVENKVKESLKNVQKKDEELESEVDKDLDDFFKEIE